MKNYNLLKEYIEENNELPKYSTSYKNVRLGNWINSQRQNYKKKKLSQERIKLLENIDNWVWKIR